MSQIIITIEDIEESETNVTVKVDYDTETMDPTNSVAHRIGMLMLAYAEKEFITPVEEIH